jgi:predicted PurR-regulated permease PerM
MVTSRINSRWIALLVAAGVVFYLCWLMIQPFVDVLLWAVVLAMLSYPLFARLLRRGYSKSVSAAVTLVVVVLGILLPLTLVTAAVVKQGGPAVDAVHDGVNKLLDPNSGLARWVGKYVDVGPLLDRRAWAARVGAVGSVVAARTLGILGGVIGGVVQAFFVMFTLYYLLRDSDRIIPAVRGMLPLTDVEAEMIFARTRDVISASVNGVLVIAAVQGFLGMLAFLFLGLPSALLWGVVMFLASMIPMLGAAIVWAPAAIYLLVTGHWVKAIVLTAWGALVVGTIDNILRPKLVGKRAQLHELVIFFSVLGGLQVFGVLGLFVGPVVAAIALALVDVFGRMNEADRLAQRVEEAASGVAAVPVADAAATTDGTGGGVDGATAVNADQASAPASAGEGSISR